nr:DUF4241 domain-containing protein [Micromonospora sp. DSM 115978]
MTTFGRATPVEVRLVSWNDHYLGVWTYDERGRRTGELDLRLLDDGRLLRLYTDRWEYTDPDMAEFAEKCERVTHKVLPDGSSIQDHRRPDGLLCRTCPHVSDTRSLPRPAFGDSPSLVDDGPLTCHDADPPAERHTGDAVDEWRPPRPKSPPPHLDALFRPGTRLLTDFEPMTVLDVRRVGEMRLPSGRLVVDCPATGAGRELTVRLPPGRYPVEIAEAAYAYDYWGKHQEGVWTTAVRLRVSGESVLSWEMGLGPGEDVRMLRNGQAYGFDADAGTVGFADGAAWPELCATFREAETPAEEPGDGFRWTAHKAMGADLVSFRTGTEMYVVWVGRGRSGDVAAVAVDISTLRIEVL